MIELTTKRLLIRMPKDDDKKCLASFEAKNKKHWQPYTSNLGEDVTSEDYWEKKLKEYSLEFSNEQSVRFLLFESQNSRDTIGICNYTQIFRGPFHACYLGFKIDRDFEGKGLMHEALEKTIAYMFEVRNLHRIMANFVPTNHRSEKLLTKLGFQKEGHAKNYLMINGKWQDHILTSFTNPNWEKRV